MHAICDPRPAPAARARAPWLASVLLLALAACEGDEGPAGPTGPPGPPGPPTPPGPTPSELEPSEDPPGIDVELLELSGGSGATGSFQSGDTLALRFRVDKDDGTPWDIAEMESARALVSGPSFNFQRVLPEVDDVAERAVFQADGSYVYEFAEPLPEGYAAPYNDTPSFGPEHGELTGDALLTGTYAVGLSFVWRYTVEEDVFHDVGEATESFLVGEGTSLAPRDVVGNANCTACHVELQAHGGLRRDLAQCLMCHTAGSEDLNDPGLGGGTPGVTVEASALLHRIHNGAHLPSVLGIGLNPDGTLNYAQTPEPLLFASSEQGLRDFSDVGFPVWPNRSIPMPKDEGYSSLTPSEQAQEDAVRSGVTRCDACHGDPDGTGPAVAPTQGDLIYAQPSRSGCGDCHDDVDWALDYKVNAGTVGFMPPQPDDSQCIFCHDPSFPDSALAVFGAHRHPVYDPLFDPGLRLELLRAAEGAHSNDDGTIDAGEGIALTFRIEDASGAPVDPADVDSIRALFAGPSHNSNLVVESEIPIAALPAGPVYVVDLPERLQLEHVGDSTAGTGDVFTTERPGHLDVSGAETEVRVRTATSGGASALSAAAPALQNFVDVASAAGFARDDWVVIDDGAPGLEEYLRIQHVEGGRLWFSSPATPAYAAGLRHAHAAGVGVAEVTLEEQSEGPDYTLDAALGQITEVSEFGAGAAVVVSYTADWLMPAVYPLSENGSPDLDETWGEWTGKSIVSGTYRVTLTAHRLLEMQLHLESNVYASTAPAVFEDLAVGSASALEPYALISSGENCNACHKEVYFHGGAQRGFDACIACHGAAGSEDRPRYVAANAPATPGETVNFRTLLHSIHRGSSLAKAATFTVVGEGEAPWPDNFGLNSYAEIEFPAKPGATRHCTKCHGADNEVWIEPAPRDHPTQQGLHVRSWRAACATCHDSDAALAHVDSQTSPSAAEACAICHGPGEDEEVELMHKAR